MPDNKVLQCRQAPYGDFCGLNPLSAGGKVAWTSELSSVEKFETTKKVPCAI